MIYKGEDMDIIDLYVRNMSVSNVRDFAYKNDIDLSDEETDFVYNFIKNNYREVIKNRDSFDLSAYKEKFSEENYQKLKELVKEYIKYLKKFY